MLLILLVIYSIFLLILFIIFMIFLLLFIRLIICVLFILIIIHVKSATIGHHFIKFFLSHLLPIEVYKALVTAIIAFRSLWFFCILNFVEQFIYSLDFIFYHAWGKNWILCKVSLCLLIEFLREPFSCLCDDFSHVFKLFFCNPWFFGCKLLNFVKCLSQRLASILHGFFSRIKFLFPFFILFKVYSEVLWSCIILLIAGILSIAIQPFSQIFQFRQMSWHIVWMHKFLMILYLKPVSKRIY